jgi:hypothetical protein
MRVQKERNGKREKDKIGGKENGKEAGLGAEKKEPEPPQ